MSSYEKGKAEAKQWILENIPKGKTCLDVGACDGLWFRLLGDHLKMDACEAFEPNIIAHDLRNKYNKVMPMPIQNWFYWFYYLVIFGDVIEHMTIADAVEVLEYAKEHSKVILVAVPFRYPQGAIYGNPYEEHKQPDLTHEIFMKRYPGFEPLFIYDRYGYYVWRAPS